VVFDERIRFSNLIVEVAIRVVRYSHNMNGELDLVTVYRSADSDADQDAEAMLNYLAAKGLHPAIVDDDAVGVVPGSYEVRVPASEASAAEALVNSFDPDAPQQADPSPELDMVPIASMMGATGEMEAMGMKSVLDAAGIPNVLIGGSTLPNLEFQVRVAQADVAQAKAVLAEAEAAGPAAAIEGERESELNPNAGQQV
jgi:hypothetical protein